VNAVNYNGRGDRASVPSGDSVAQRLASRLADRDVVSSTLHLLQLPSEV